LSQQSETKISEQAYHKSVYVSFYEAFLVLLEKFSDRVGASVNKLEKDNEEVIQMFDTEKELFLKEHENKRVEFLSDWNRRKNDSLGSAELSVAKEFEVRIRDILPNITKTLEAHKNELSTLLRKAQDINKVSFSNLGISSFSISIPFSNGGSPKKEDFLNQVKETPIPTFFGNVTKRIKFS